MKSKRGDLLNNVLGLLIAVIGIGLLVFAVVKLYGVTVNQEEENAKNILNVIEGKIKPGDKVIADHKGGKVSIAVEKPN